MQDRHRSLGNSRFGFVSARRKAEVKLGLGLKLDLEVELRSVQFSNKKSPIGWKTAQEASSDPAISSVSTRTMVAGGSIVIEAFDGQ